MTRVSQRVERADLLSLVEQLYDLADRYELSAEAEVLRRFNKREINVLLELLDGLGVIGGNHAHADEPFGCDVCEEELAPLGLFVDGPVSSGGPWAIMCPKCFEGGAGALGWGAGQLYAQRQQGWQCIGGGDPEPPGGWDG